jgi:hypothetical protein
LAAPRLEHGGHVNGKIREQHRSRRRAARELAVQTIGGAVEDRHDDRFSLGIDDPVLVNARLRVLVP